MFHRQIKQEPYCIHLWADSKLVSTHWLPPSANFIMSMCLNVDWSGFRKAYATFFKTFSHLFHYWLYLLRGRRVEPTTGHANFIPPCGWPWPHGAANTRNDLPSEASVYGSLELDDRWRLLSYVLYCCTHYFLGLFNCVVPVYFDQCQVLMYIMEYVSKIAQILDNLPMIGSAPHSDMHLTYRPPTMHELQAELRSWGV